VSLDLTLDIHKTIIPDVDLHTHPHRLLEQHIAAGRLGFKTGNGFRAWTADQMAELRARLVGHLVQSQREQKSE
jgi:3-hydroxybutyryl-CoA dehydrogenase